MPAPLAKTVFLHIGTQKTGTTTLQTVGRENREALARQGVLYPLAPGRTNHTGLTLYAAGAIGNRDLMREAGLSSAEDVTAYQRALPVRLSEEIASSGCPTVWLSNEHLSSRVRQSDQLRRVADMLHHLGETVTVVVYLRHQPEFYLSSYSMNIKAGSSKETLPPQSERDYYYNYDMMLSVWAEAFGEKAIKVRVYERPALMKGDVVDDMFAIMGIRRTEDMAIPSSLNPSLDANVLQFLRLFRTHVPRYIDDLPNPEHADVTRALEAMSDGPRFAVSGSMMRAIAEMFADSNARVARRFLNRPNGQLFTPVTYPDGDGTEPLTVEKAVEIAARLWCFKQRQLIEFKAERRTSREARRKLMAVNE